MTLSILSLQKALLNPRIYPDHPKKVGFFETHISLLFFTGNHVYKVKKPVDFGFLDFTSLEKRKYFCEQEVRLNRRLSPEIYLGVIKIIYDGRRILLDGRGEVVEYAVKMKQIPEELLMDELLGEGQVTPKMVEAFQKNWPIFTRPQRPVTSSKVLRNQSGSNRIQMKTLIKQKNILLLRSPKMSI